MIDAGWFAGAVVYCVLLLIRSVRCMKLLRATAVETSASLEERCQRIAEQVGIRRGIRLLVSFRGIEPAAYGIWKPTVVIPHHLLDTSSDAQLDTILAHELQHIRRGDCLVGILRTTLKR